MAGKAKFDQEAAFKSIVGMDRQSTPGAEAAGQPSASGVDKALRRMSLEEDKKLTEAVNEILRIGLKKYLEY